jgi:hypothetical protein
MSSAVVAPRSNREWSVTPVQTPLTTPKRSSSISNSDVPILAGEPSCVSTLQEYEDLIEETADVPDAAESISTSLINEAREQLENFGSVNGIGRVAAYIHRYATAKGFDHTSIELVEYAGY